MIKKLTIAASLLALAGQTCAQTVKPATANKGDTEVNPILPYNLCADPTAVEYNGRLYIYGTNDQQELNTTKNTTKNTYGQIKQLVCISSADLVNWTFHEPIDVKAKSSWIATSWAPSIVSRYEEKDKKTHFYLYYTNTASGVGMLTATSPTGPWTDPLGHALIDGRTPGRGQQSNIIDPGVCIDDEGNGWLAFGGGDPNSSGTKLMPGNARIVKLGKDMKSLSGEIKEIKAPFHFEANELNYINGKFIFSYSGGWSCNSGDWSRYEGKGSYGCPGNCSILMMQTDDPINGEWTYTGEMLRNPGNFGNPWGNNHSHMQKFGGKYYMLYHTQAIESKMGISGGYRGICIDKITVDTAKVKITAPSMTKNGPGMITENRPTTADYLEAEMMANSAGITVTKQSGALGMAVTDIHAGDWTLLRGLKFAETAKSVTVRLKGKCKLEFRLSKTGKPFATVESTKTSWQNITVDLNDSIPADKVYANVFMVFTEATGTCMFDRYRFNPLTVEETTPIEAVHVGADEVLQEVYYDINGVQQAARPQKGMYIRRSTMSDGTIRTEKHVAK